MRRRGRRRQSLIKISGHPGGKTNEFLPIAANLFRYARHLFRRLELLTKLMPKSILIVAIGADNVHGTGIGKRRTGGVPVGEAFPAQLQALLRTRGLDADVINAGVGGDTTAGMLGQLDSAVPEGTQLVIVDRANGNDKKAGLKAKQAFYIQQIKGRLTARHIAVIVLPAWRKIPGAVANRAWDDHHFTAKGHASIARYLLRRRPPAAAVSRSRASSFRATRSRRSICAFAGRLG